MNAITQAAGEQSSREVMRHLVGPQSATSSIWRWPLRMFLRGLLAFYLVLARLARFIGRKKRPPASHEYDILLTGTFYADNWVASHLGPLANSARVARVRMVAVRRVPQLPKVEGVYPPSWLCCTIGAVPARLLTFLWVGLRTRPDIVGGFHLLFNAMTAEILAPLIGAQSMYFCVGGVTETLHHGRSENRLFGRLGVPDKTITRRLLKIISGFDFVITMGSGAQEFFRRHGIAGACHVVSGGIDGHQFTPRQRARSMDLITVCRLVPVKRIDLLLHAVRRVREVLPAVTLTIVGDGPLRPALERMALELGVDKNVRFVGYQGDVREWLAQAKIYVLTSDSEGLSLALMEATMAGLPAVVSNVGDLSDLIHEGVNGYLVSERTPEEFAARIVDLLTDTARLERFAQAARRYAQRFDSGATSRLWDDILDRARAAATDVFAYHTDGVRQ